MGKGKSIASFVLGCIALILIIFSGIMCLLYFSDPLYAARAAYDSSLSEWAAVFNLIKTLFLGGVGILAGIFVVIMVFICSFISLGTGIPALILSFNPYRTKLKVFGRIFGIIGIVFGTAVLVTAIVAGTGIYR